MCNLLLSKFKSPRKVSKKACTNVNNNQLIQQLIVSSAEEKSNREDLSLSSRARKFGEKWAWGDIHGGAAAARSWETEGKIGTKQKSQNANSASKMAKVKNWLPLPQGWCRTGSGSSWSVGWLSGGKAVSSPPCIHWKSSWHLLECALC